MTEAYRLRLLRGIEDLLAESGYALVAGVDEAGRGCLAGPVVAAAVIMSPDSLVPGVDDSKRLTAEQREAMSLAIRSSAKATAVAAVSAATIDRINILEATRVAMREALLSLEPQPDCALVDAVTLEDLRFPVVAMVRADAVNFAVACASIVAKVARDRMMEQFDSQYPGYDLNRNKGYGAPSHRRALAELGPTPIHRLTFRSVLPRHGEVVEPALAGRGV